MLGDFACRVILCASPAPELMAAVCNSLLGTVQSAALFQALTVAAL